MARNQEGNNTNLLHLNEYCLLKVLDYFSTVELLCLTETCNSFKTFIYNNSSKFFKNINAYEILKHLSVDEFLDMIQHVGSSVRVLTIENTLTMITMERILDNTIDYFKSLERINFCGVDFRCMPNEKKLKTLIVKLKILSLENCESLEFFENIFENSEQLDDLHISESELKLEDGFFNKLFSLKSLTIQLNYHLTKEILGKILINNRNLTKLVLKASREQRGKIQKIFDTLTTNGHTIEDLTMTDIFNKTCDRLIELPKLKKITCEFGTQHPLPLEKLAEKNILEEIKLCSKYSYTREDYDSIKHILKMTTLKKLHLENFDINEQILMDPKKNLSLEHLVIKTKYNIPGAFVLSLLQGCKKLKYMEISHLYAEEAFLDEIISLLHTEKRERPFLNFKIHGTYVQSYNNDAVKEPCDTFLKYIKEKENELNAVLKLSLIPFECLCDTEIYYSY